MTESIWHHFYDTIFMTSFVWRHQKWQMLLFSMIISIRQYGLNEFNSENSIYWPSKIPSLSKSNLDETFQRPSTSIGYIDVGDIWGHNLLVIVFKSWWQIWSFFSPNSHTSEQNQALGTNILTTTSRNCSFCTNIHFALLKYKAG